LPGETIPIRLFLGGFDLTPTFRDVNKKYSTRYYLSLVLIDEGKQKKQFHLLVRMFLSLAWILPSISLWRTNWQAVRLGKRMAIIEASFAACIGT
jgi:hypothetical protein